MSVFDPAESDLPGHTAKFRRYNRGRSVIAGPSGSFYGVEVICSCGEYRTRVNQAASSGGRKKGIFRWWFEHVHPIQKEKS